jgi:hypothetical protein
MKHLFFSLLIFTLTLATVEAEETELDKPVETVNAEQIELPRLLIHQNTFNALKFQFTDGVKVPPGQLTTLLNIPENEQVLRKAKNYTIISRIFNTLTFVSAAGVFIYAGFDDLPYANTMLTVSLCTVVGSTLTGLFTEQGAAVNYLRAVDNYNLYIMGIPIGKIVRN